MRFVFLFLLFITFSSYATTQLKTQIYDINQGNIDEETLVFLTSGHVIRITRNDLKRIETFQFAKDKNQWVNLGLDKQQKITNYHFSNPESSIKKRREIILPIIEDYIPTVIEGEDLARKYFRDAYYVDKESQCYNRAHIWSYEWFTKFGINSNKTWLFFTRRYIRKFKFDWWFHVSPSVRVLEKEILREKIMDVKYGNGPLNLKAWTDIFMKDDANCPMVTTYSDYANFPESGSCYTMRSSMYYYQPIDLESREIWNSIKINWYPEEIKQAYLEAFDQIN